MKPLTGRPADYWVWMRYITWQIRLRRVQIDLIRRRRVMAL